jgi:hypothetical protein
MYQHMTTQCATMQHDVGSGARLDVPLGVARVVSDWKEPMSAVHMFLD